MTVIKSITVPVQNESDVVGARQVTRQGAIAQGFSLVDLTKIVTAASELARNTVIYGKGGTLTLEILEDGARKGLRLTFEDNGPGIANLELALTDGYTSGSGLGLGLSGARRLSNEFKITSEPDKGCKVMIARWK